MNKKSIKWVIIKTRLLGCVFFCIFAAIKMWLLQIKVFLMAFAVLFVLMGYIIPSYAPQIAELWLKYRKKQLTLPKS